ncbi:heparan-alpha-glucosaminide N-acetyltransferase [Tabrizicola sp. YIM 78059]|uniref:heparan-alpha-glucosaminide N-acetyltransferase n=1 Tax=Tabrizicola sp. YIM 78059 TaxID=2529861 RepID=UPI0010A9C4ED|nr:heparan-alpha-glucosaminide N-acetyltransferase [Tabrizicola sp. YIM 78059]
MTDPDHPAGRLIALDLARTIAIVCMVIFHYTFDLALFGHIPPETIYQPFWYYFARAIAGSFLFLSGVSLWLAHGQGVRWRPFWVRWARIAGAAVLVTLASLWFVSGGPIWFGILHAIAAVSLLGLAALRLPWPATLALAAAVFAIGVKVQSPAFDPIWLVWTGLAESRPMMGDYVPLFPWAAPALAGIGLARALRIDRWPARLPSPTLRRLAFPGRHSLIIYLVHQPILIGLFSLHARITGG